MVIIFTDGLANKGIGSLEEENPETQQFYDKLSTYAYNNGIAISLITLKGEECKVKVLGKITEDTNGHVTRIDPTNIGNDFSNLLKDEIVGT